MGRGRHATVRARCGWYVRLPRAVVLIAIALGLSPQAANAAAKPAYARYPSHSAKIHTGTGTTMATASPRGAAQTAAGPALSSAGSAQTSTPTPALTSTAPPEATRSVTGSGTSPAARVSNLAGTGTDAALLFLGAAALLIGGITLLLLAGRRGRSGKRR